MENFKTILIVTGKIPNENLLRYNLHQYYLMFISGLIDEVIISSWDEDIKKNDSIFKLYKDFFSIINNGEYLKEKSFGNYLDQMVTLHNALIDIEENALIIKSRPDLIYINYQNWIPNILRKIKIENKNKTIENNKIWIPFFHPLFPFFIADLTYIGMSSEIKKYINFNFEHEALKINILNHGTSLRHPSAHIPEFKFWSNPYRNEYPQLKEYSKIIQFMMNGHPQFKDIISYCLKCELYWEYLAIYWNILYDKFITHQSEIILAESIDHNGTIYIRDHYKNITVENFPDDLIDISNIDYPFRISDTNELAKFVNGKKFSINYDEIYHKAIKSISNPKFDKNRFINLNQMVTNLKLLSQP